jgi:hypothetical protein
MNPIALILAGRGADAKPIIMKALSVLAERKLAVLRKVVASTVYEDTTEKIDEAMNRMRQGRTVLIRRRIRKGKLQRNIRRSAVKGFTLRRGKITRIPVARRIHMRIVQRRASRKRKAHMQQTLRKRKLSMRKRKALGIK